MKKIPQRLIDKVINSRNSRNWHDLPTQFEQRRVKTLCREISDTLKFIDTTGTIKERIELAKIDNFKALYLFIGGIESTK